MDSNLLTDTVIIGTAFVVKATALLVCAFVAMLCFRRKTSAALKHLLWRCTFASLFFLFLMTAIPFAITLRTPASGTVSSLVPGPRILAPEFVVIWAHKASESSRPVYTGKPVTDAGPISPSSLPESTRAASAETLSTPSSPSPDAVTAELTSHPILFALNAILAIWVVGTFAVSGWLFTGLKTIRRMTTGATLLRADSPLIEAFEAARKTVDSPRPIQVRQSDKVPVPLTWGVRRPCVLLPADTEVWTSEQVRVALLHEIAHIVRNDWAWQIFGYVVCALYWWHPLTWAAMKRLQSEAEYAADDCVLQSGIPSKTYARHLLSIAAQVSPRLNALHVATPMATGPYLEPRLRAVLHAKTRTLPRSVARTTALLWTALAVGIGITQASYKLAPPNRDQNSAKNRTPHLDTASPKTQGPFTLAHLLPASDGMSSGTPVDDYFFRYFFTERDENGTALYFTHPDVRRVHPDTNHDLPLRNNTFTVRMRLSNGDLVPVGYQAGRADSGHQDQNLPPLLRVIIPSGFPETVTFADVTLTDQQGHTGTWRIADLPRSRHRVLPTEATRTHAPLGNFRIQGRVWRTRYEEPLGYSYGPRPNVLGVTVDLGLHGPPVVSGQRMDLRMDDVIPEWDREKSFSNGSGGDEVGPNGTAHIRGGVFVPYVSQQTRVRVPATLRRYTLKDESLNFAGVILRRHDDHFDVVLPRPITQTTSSGVRVTLENVFGTKKYGRSLLHSGLENRLTLYVRVVLPAKPAPNRTSTLEGTASWETAATMASGTQDKQVELLLHVPPGVRSGQKTTLGLLIRQRTDEQTVSTSLVLPVEKADPTYRQK